MDISPGFVHGQKESGGHLSILSPTLGGPKHAAGYQERTGSPLSHTPACFARVAMSHFNPVATLDSVKMVRFFLPSSIGP
jgi:hypothetical protein